MSPKGRGDRGFKRPIPAGRVPAKHMEHFFLDAGLAKVHVEHSHSWMPLHQERARGSGRGGGNVAITGGSAFYGRGNGFISTTMTKDPQRRETLAC